MNGDVLLVGVLLAAVLPVMFAEGSYSSRAGYTAEFWRLERDAKLDHIAGTIRAWWITGVSWVLYLVLLVAGSAGLAALLAEEGEPVLSWVSAAAFGFAAVGWLAGVSVQTATVAEAAKRRAESGQTPDWLAPAWMAAYITEGLWVLAGCVAYAGFGIAIIQTDLLSDWVGWAVLVISVVIPMLVLALRNGFPQLPVLAPIIVGIGLIVAAF